MSEVVKQLEEKIEKYENILEAALGEKKFAGVVIAGPLKKEKHPDMYRVQGDDGSTNFLIVSNDTQKFKKGDSVLATKGLIVETMPDILELKREPPKFTFIKWEDVGGMKSQIEEIRTSIELPLTHADIYKEFGAKPIKGMLLFGPPGCGKTMIAKAVASAIMKGKNPDMVLFIYIKGAELLSMYVGQTEGRIRRLFDECREHYTKTGNRAILFIDEADGLLPERGSRRSSDVETTIVPTFLAEMDGFEENGPLVILSTNKPNTLDPAVLREGRIDLKIHITYPTREDVTEIFKIHLSKTKIAGKIDEIAEGAMEEIFNHRKKVSGATVEAVVKLATEFAIKRKIKNPSVKTGVILEDISRSIQKIEHHQQQQAVVTEAA